MQIPSSFVTSHANLTWADTLWGYERQMLGWSDAVQLAAERVERGLNDPLAIELSGLSKSEAHQAGDLLRSLAAKEKPTDAETSNRKWLYLVLSWLFEKRADFVDPLGEVEAVYADFGYPMEVEDFVRYMPPKDGYDPAGHSLAENEDRLINLWQRYLLESANEFKS